MTTTKVVRTSPHAALRAELERLTPSYERLLPKHYDPARLITGAMVAIAANPDLLQCDPKSVGIALARVAQWGLDVGDTAHLVPFGRQCTAIVDYKGYIRLMMQAGARKVEAHEVREGDEFEYEYGAEPRLIHRPLADRSRPITAAYAIVWLRGGVKQFEVMTADEIDAIRRAKSKQWKAGPLEGWYARKTVLRRVAKYVPKSGALEQALVTDGAAFDPETGEVLTGDVPALASGEDAVKPGDAFEAEL